MSKHIRPGDGDSVVAILFRTEVAFVHGAVLHWVDILVPVGNSVEYYCDPLLDVHMRCER